MATEEPKAIIVRLYDEVMNQGKFALLDEVVAIANWELRRSIEQIRRTFPDLSVTIEESIGEGDKVVIRSTWRGTHLGPWGFPKTRPDMIAPCPPTGKQAVF